MTTTYGIDLVRDNVNATYTVSDTAGFTAGGSELVEVADGPMVPWSGGCRTVAITLPAGALFISDRGNVVNAAQPTTVGDQQRVAALLGQPYVPASTTVLLGLPEPTGLTLAFSAVSFETP